ncbi:MAG: hypothetical protein KJZ93_05440 [Caldilineaceae bacterium]|nr:hypothetical protein [Caldilineaceae bacterium]
MRITLLDPHAPTWGAQLDSLYRRLGGGDNPTLFPYHFLHATLPRIGGHIVCCHQGETLCAAGFLFPCQTPSFTTDQRDYVLRYHHVAGAPAVDMPALQAHVSVLLQGAAITLYDPLGELHFPATHEQFNGVDIGRPDAGEAAAIRALQREVWGSPPEFLYPVDIHSVEFGLGASLVARVDGQPAGFLFGFVKFGGHSLPADWRSRFGGGLRLESQALGVLPAYRGARIGFLLKKAQAQHARQAGIQLVNWTVDPLQWPNAVLNFGLLRALAFDFTPDYYPFRNELNRVAASRFSLTWLVGAPRVAAALAPLRRPPIIIDLAQTPAILRVNQGTEIVHPTPDAPQISLEIPADWTALQRADLDEATAWRAATDRLFAQLIGARPGQYVITDVGVDSAQRFLIGRRVDAATWDALLTGP